MAEKKMTIVEMYEGIIAKYPLNDEEKTFLESRIAQVVNKSKSNSAKQKEKELERNAVAEKLLAFMVAHKPSKYRVTELLSKEWAEDTYSAPYVTNILTKMLADGKVAKSIEKGASYYSAV